MAIVLKTAPKVVGEREYGYGGHIYDTRPVFRYLGKNYLSSGVAFSSLEEAIKGSKPSDLVFPVRAAWLLCHPFKGKPKSKRRL